MNSSRYTTPEAPVTTKMIWVAKEIPLHLASMGQPVATVRFAPLKPLRQWLEGLEICDRETAHRICRLIPAQCPFERTIQLFGRTILRIPPMCKLNPLYEEVVALRFRALCYLADECGEDISAYC
ncbi:Mo-dependent nitrogenase C-terminal domain-containing protein [Pantanalinema rosaneae CENA516]|uniref:Mo-dependent nitrogenase C-terminal domain-containing protein n=1 Tax=Pantanalinema rosaneae TaxID=1620701 RepID=UPI003D6E16FC